MTAIGSPLDPFQGGSVSRDPIQLLARRWDAGWQKSEAATDDVEGWAAYHEIKAVEAEIFALPQNSLALVSLKLRVLAMWLAVDKSGWDNGVRTDPLDCDEEMLASALADLERLAGSAT